MKLKFPGNHYIFKRYTHKSFMHIGGQKTCVDLRPNGPVSPLCSLNTATQVL